MTGPTETFAKLHEASRAIGETNDCAVKAASVVTGLPYKTVHAMMAKHGRKPRRGTPVHEVIFPSLKELGFDVEVIPMPKGAKTVTTLERKLPDHGAYFVLTHRWRHALGCNGGRVHDWTAGRRHRLDSIYRVTRIADATPVKDSPTDQISLI